MKITSAYERRIRERWETLEPGVIIWLKTTKSLEQYPKTFETALGAFKRIHKAAVLTCLDYKIPFHRMRQYEIDDPRISDIEREMRIAKFLEIRRRHPGRSPSLGRASNKRPAAILPGDI